MFDSPIKSGKDEKLDVILDELKQLKNVNKITELDLEKRIVILESGLSEIRDLLGSINKVQDLKQFISHMDDIKGRLQEIEDFALIEKLETVELKDEMDSVTGANDTIRKKVDLLVEAVRNIDPNEGDMAKTLNSVDDLRKKTEKLDHELEELRLSGVTKENFEQIRS